MTRMNQHVTMAFARLPVCAGLCLLVFAASTVRASSSAGNDRTGGSAASFTCNQVRELFEGGLGSPKALHSQPELETGQSLCRREGAGSEGGGDSDSGEEYTCCSADTEQGLAERVEDRLKGSVRHHNTGLRKRLTNVLARYTDRLRQLTDEAENRTAAFLSRLHKIPWAEHRPVVANLYRGLGALMARGPAVEGGEAVGEVDDVVRDFFVNLFPAVFNYVLSGREQGDERRRPVSGEYHACLKRYADQIQPFGNQPDRLLRSLRRSLRHARAFQDALRTLLDAMASTQAAAVEGSCRRALFRLQVCPGCRGVSVRTPGSKPCRGLCLNVMRGCLAKMSEVSSSWDDLVVAFENLQVGMLGHYDLQKLLIYLDMNVSDAIMMAMDDSPRIYDEVRVKCQDVPRSPPTPADPLPLLPDSSGGGGGGDGDGGNPDDTAAAAISPRSTRVLKDFRQEMRALVKVLDDSKGRFNRLPDWLCEGDSYAQDMLSQACWNGSAVGRYMEQVPEANFLSQVQRNKEVKVSLVDPDFRFLQVKESLTHMRRNLTGLLNSDIMQGDRPHHPDLAQGGGGGGHARGGARGGPSPYRALDQEGSGRMYHHDVIVDDEDLIAGESGSGSGSGDDRDDEGEGGTSRPTETPITRRPTGRTPGAASAPALSAILLPLAVGLHVLLGARH